NGEVQGQIVFVGQGISSTSQKHDDYSGLDVKGKIVLIAPGTPADVDASRLAENESGQGAAIAHGAGGILQLPPQRMLDLMKNKGFQERAASRETVRLARATEGKLPALSLGPALAEELLSSGGLNLKSVYEAISHKEKLQPKKLDVSAKMTVATQVTRSTTQNVAAILEGSDPKLRN